MSLDTFTPPPSLPGSSQNPFSNLKAQSEIKSCLSELNKDLHECNLQIKGMLLNGTEVYAIVNIVRRGGRERGNG